MTQNISPNMTCCPMMCVRLPTKKPSSKPKPLNFQKLIDPPQSRYYGTLSVYINRPEFEEKKDKEKQEYFMVVPPCICPMHGPFCANSAMPVVKRLDSGVCVPATFCPICPHCAEQTETSEEAKTGAQEQKTGKEQKTEMCTEPCDPPCKCPPKPKPKCKKSKPEAGEVRPKTSESKSKESPPKVSSETKEVKELYKGRENPIEEIIIGKDQTKVKENSSDKVSLEKKGSLKGNIPSKEKEENKEQEILKRKKETPEEKQNLGVVGNPSDPCNCTFKPTCPPPVMFVTFKTKCHST